MYEKTSCHSPSSFKRLKSTESKSGRFEYFPLLIPASNPLRIVSSLAVLYRINAAPKILGLLKEKKKQIFKYSL